MTMLQSLSLGPERRATGGARATAAAIGGKRHHMCRELQPLEPSSQVPQAAQKAQSGLAPCARWSCGPLPFPSYSRFPRLGCHYYLDARLSYDLKFHYPYHTRFAATWLTLTGVCSLVSEQFHAALSRPASPRTTQLRPTEPQMRAKCPRMTSSYGSYVSSRGLYRVYRRVEPVGRVSYLSTST